LQSGYALDCCGNDIVVPVCAATAINAMGARPAHEPRCADWRRPVRRHHAEDPCAVPVRAETTVGDHARVLQPDESGHRRPRDPAHG